MAATTFQDKSKTTWTSERNTIEDVNCGSLQRIADSLEVVSKNYVALQNERDRFAKWYREEQEKLKASERSNAALRGVITKLKQDVQNLTIAADEKAVG